MIEHIQDIIETHPEDCKETNTAPTPANINSFKTDDSKKLSPKGRESFHSLVAKALFVCK